MADPQAGGLSAPGTGEGPPEGRRGAGMGTALIAGLLLLNACDPGAANGAAEVRVPSSKPDTEQGPVVGLVGTMTGPGAWRGDDAFEGADLGVHVLNRSRSERREPYELVTLDDRGDPARALALVERVAAEEATAGVVYAGPPEALVRAEDALAEAGVPAILCFGDLPVGPLRGPHLYQTSPPLPWQAEHLASYILKDRRYRTTGLVMERSAYGRKARDALQRALAGGGGRRAHTVGYLPGDDNLAAQLARLRRRGIEALVAGGGPDLVERLEAALGRMGALYESTREAKVSARDEGGRIGPWRPQLLLFDLGISEGTGLAPGTVGAESYGRGAHYLPLPAFRRWRSAFLDWWDERPDGWELRSYQAVKMIGWAASRAGPGQDLASSLDHAGGAGFAGMVASFGARDHRLVEPEAMGLWVIPRRGASVAERGLLPPAMPWVPLARTFDIGAAAGRTLGGPRDLWNRRPDGSLRLRFGVKTPRSDPIH